MKHHLETEFKYKVYLDKQKRVCLLIFLLKVLSKEIENLKKEEYRSKLDDINFDELESSISKEEREKLKSNNPQTIYAASRIPGIKPSTLIYLHHLVKKKKAKIIMSNNI